MSRRVRKAKPKSPAEILAERADRLARERARDFAAVGMTEGASDLVANTDVVVERAGARTSDGGRRAQDGGRRMDAFDALRDGMAAGAYDAARKLELNMRIRRGEQDRGPALDRVDGKPRAGDRTDDAVAAGILVDKVLGNIGERSAWLLSELIYPMQSGRPWRETVFYCTGETNPHAQCAVVRLACANLVSAFALAEGRSTPIIRNTVWRAPEKEQA